MRGRNLLDPLTFQEGEVQQFVQRHRCAICRGSLIYRHVPDRLYTVECLEHGPIMDHNQYSIYDAERQEQKELAVQKDLRPPRKEKRSQAEILSDLGF